MTYPEFTTLDNFAAYAKAHLPPSQVIVRSLPLHADILARDERSPGARVLPEPHQDATYAANIVGSVALFNHNYVHAALAPVHKQRVVGLAGRWMAGHRAGGTGSEGGDRGGADSAGGGGKES